MSLGPLGWVVFGHKTLYIPRLSFYLSNLVFSYGCSCVYPLVGLLSSLINLIMQYLNRNDQIKGLKCFHCLFCTNSLLYLVKHSAVEELSISGNDMI